jgi:hypothetical protein
MLRVPRKVRDPVVMLTALKICGSGPSRKRVRKGVTAAVLFFLV